MLVRNELQLLLKSSSALTWKSLMQPRRAYRNHELSFSFQKDQRINSELLKLAVSSRGTSELSQQWHAVALLFHVLSRELGEQACQQGTVDNPRQESSPSCWVMEKGGRDPGLLLRHSQNTAVGR